MQSLGDLQGAARFAQRLAVLDLHLLDELGRGVDVEIAVVDEIRPRPGPIAVDSLRMHDITMHELELVVAVLADLNCASVTGNLDPGLRTFSQNSLSRSADSPHSE